MYFSLGSINTDIFSLNIRRYLDINQSRMFKALEKLSSGVQINRASDNVAGLSIGTKLETQIRGTNQAIANTQDGINLINTAEGGINTITDILQRIRELILQSANDTNTQSDREKIQIEINELLKAIDDIANQTEFNGKKLLNRGRVEPTSLQYTTSTFANIGNEAEGIAFDKKTGNLFVVSSSVNKIYKVTPDGVVTSFADTLGGYTDLTIDNLGNVYTADLTNIIKITPAGVTSVFTTGIIGGNHSMTIDRDNNIYVIETLAGKDRIAKITPDGAISTYIQSDYFDMLVDVACDSQGNLFVSDAVTNNIYKVTPDGVISTFVENLWGTLAFDKVDNLYVISAASNIIKITPKGLMTTIANINNGFFIDINNIGDIYVSTSINNTVEKIRAPSPQIKDDNAESPLSLTLQVGPNEGQTFRVDMVNITTTALGIEILDISTPKINPYDALLKVNKAIDNISTQRAHLGAQQNRLEGITNYLSSMYINLSDTKSRIMDTDIAKEIANLVKYQILVQAGTLLLAQVSQIRRNFILSLL